MKKSFLLITALIISYEMQAVSFTAGTLTLDNEAYEKTICYNGSSGVITHTGKKVSGGTGQWVNYYKTVTERWEKSEDGTNFNTINMDDDYLNNIITTTWIRKYIKVQGTYATILGGPFAFSKDDYTNTVVISPRARLTSGVIRSDEAICYNTTPSGIKSTTLPAGGTNQFSFTWELNAGSGWTEIAGQSANIYSPGALTQTTLYRRVETDAVCGSVYSNTITKTVYEVLSEPTVTTSEISSCYNTTPVPITVSSANGGNGSFTYLWQSSQNYASWSDISSSKNNLTYQPPALTATTYYRLKATSDYGCGSVYSDVITISVYDALKAPAISTVDQQVCYNTTPETLKASAATGGNESFTYSWQKSTNNSSWSDIPSSNALSYSPGQLTQTTYYRLRAVAEKGCGTVYSNTLKVTVYADLSSPVISGLNQQICYNAVPALLSASAASGGNGSFDYIWQKSPDNSSFSDIAESKDILTYQPSALTKTTYYRLKAESQSSCGTVYSKSLTVKVYEEVGQPVISTSDQEICYNTWPVPFAATAASGGNGSFSYVWQSSLNYSTWSDIADSKDALTYQSPALTKTTYYRLKAEGCGTTYSDIRSVTVFNEVTADFYCNSTDVYVGDAVLFNNNSKNADSYWWIFDTVGSSDLQSPWYYFYQTGPKTITLIVTSEDNCSDTLTRENYINVITEEVTGIDETPENEIKIYPNPTDNTLNIDYVEDVSFRLTDMNGKVLLEGTIVQGHTSINIGDLPSSIYFITLSLVDRSITVKIIKQ